MTVIGITGARSLTNEQAVQVNRELVELMRGGTVIRCHVGDASGVDEIGRYVANVCQVHATWHHAEGRKPWQLQVRSKGMVNDLAKANGTLHAFVNKPCPEGVTVNSWAGSGTWGTVRYAIAKGVPVELHWLIEPCELPDWMKEKQLSLV
jgi:hypothetical protein